MGGEDGEGPGVQTSMWRQAEVAAGCERPGGFAEMVQSREALQCLSTAQSSRPVCGRSSTSTSWFGGGDKGWLSWSPVTLTNLDLEQGEMLQLPSLRPGLAISLSWVE